MCGIVGGIAAHQPIKDLLLEGLERLEYRGYDSAGLALIEPDSTFHRLRVNGKVSGLITQAATLHCQARLGMAHTRWATHGPPATANAHPHLIDNRLLVVHNGVVENYSELYDQLAKPKLSSQTDTEVVGWAVLRKLQAMKKPDLRKAMLSAAADCRGSYALLVVDLTQPYKLVAVRRGSPLVLGCGPAGVFVASDPLALIRHTSDFVFLQEGESLELNGLDWKVFGPSGQPRTRQPKSVLTQHYVNDKGEFAHFMLKEIHDQPEALENTLRSYVEQGRITFPAGLVRAMADATAVQLVACGTSAHAAMVAGYWIEELAGIRTHTEVASEFRYRSHANPQGTLYITLSQSGETADTLECLRMAKTMPYLTRLAITNSPHSSIVRDADYCLITQGGLEVSVASTKAFTTQLLVLLLCTLEIARQHKTLAAQRQRQLLRLLAGLSARIKKLIGQLEPVIEKLADELAGKSGVMYLGRHSMYPLALEGALKLKEVAYIHAEAYPAGELKHGPLALIDSTTPVVAISPPGELLHKLHINLEEVQARGGIMLLFIDAEQKFTARSFDRVVPLPSIDALLAPFFYTIPLQLLAYHTAIQCGTDVDKPRNLAKSVTVE